jgi:hypothetical protein
MKSKATSKDKLKQFYADKRVRRLAVFLLTIGLYFFVMWAYMPRATDNIFTINGTANLFDDCSSRACSKGVKVGDILLACDADEIGPSYYCPQLELPKEKVSVTYFTMPTIFSTIGLSKKSNILLRVEIEKKIIYQKDLQSIKSQYVYTPSFVLIILFVLIFLKINRSV